jgi:hypothetical protein
MRNARALRRSIGMSLVEERITRIAFVQVAFVQTGGNGTAGGRRRPV